MGKGFVGIDNDSLYKVIEGIEDNPRGFGWYYTEDRLNTLRAQIETLKNKTSHIVSCVIPLPKDQPPFDEKGSVGWWAIIMAQTKEQDLYGYVWERIPIPLDNNHLKLFYSHCHSFELRQFKLGGSQEDQ